MVAYAFKFFGIHPFIGRLPAALSAVACGMLIYGGCRPTLKPPYAALAALIFLLCPLSSIIGHVCLTDMTLCALITGTVLFLFKGLQYRSGKDLIIAHSCLALAFLCKGPIAVIICALAIVPYIVSISKTKGALFQNFMALKPVQAFLIFLGVNMPWYTMAEMGSGGKFWYTFFYEQNFGRMVGVVNHQGPFYFYIPVFFGGFFPWCLFSLAAPGLFRKTIQKKNDEPSRFRRLARLSLILFLLVMGMFSAIKTKLPTYILPALPAFAILVAMQLQVLARLGKLKSLFVPTGLITIAFVVALAIHRAVLKGYVRDIFTENIWIVAPISISLAALWFGLIKRKAQVFIPALLAIALSCCAIMVPRGLQTFYKAKQVPFNKLACRARDDKASVAMVFAEEPSVPWFTHKPVSRLMGEKDAARFLKETPAPHYVLVQTAGLPRLDWFKRAHHLVAEEGKWHLYQVDAN